MDFYANNTSGEDPPEHIGFCYVLQNNMTQSEGNATVPITSPKHLAIGQLKGTCAGQRHCGVVNIPFTFQSIT